MPCTLPSVNPFVTFGWYVDNTWMICGWYVDDIWMICGWYLEYMCNIFGWYLGNIWICKWYLDDMWVISGWYVVDTWMICRWYLDAIWVISGWYLGNICGWYLDDMLVISEWYLGGIWIICGWYLDYMWVISGWCVGDIWMMFEFERIHSETPKHNIYMHPKISVKEKTKFYYCIKNICCNITYLQLCILYMYIRTVYLTNRLLKIWCVTIYFIYILTTHPWPDHQKFKAIP